MRALIQGKLTRLWTKNSSFALAAGSGIIAPAIGLLTAPILTRMYSPSQFGVLGSFAAILASTLAVANLRYEVTVPLPQEDAEAYSLARAAMKIGLAASVVISITAMVIAPFILNVDIVEGLFRYWWWLPIALALASMTQVLTQFAIRRGEFGKLGTARLIQGITGPAVQIGLGAAGAGVVGLLIGQAASQSGGLIQLWRSFHRTHRALPDIPPAKELLKRYAHFPRLSLFPAFVNALGLQLPVLIVAYAHGAAAAGLILLILRVGAPLGILATAGGQTLLCDAAKLRREGKGTTIVIKRTVRRQFLLTLPVLVATPILPWLFPRLFGAEWVDAGKYALALIPAVAGMAILSPTAWIFDIHERQKIQVLREIVRILTMTMAVMVANKFGGGTMWAVVAAISIAMISNSIFGFFLALRIAEKDAPKNCLSTNGSRQMKAFG